MKGFVVAKVNLPIYSVMQNGKFDKPSKKEDVDRWGLYEIKDQLIKDFLPRNLQIKELVFKPPVLPRSALWLSR